MHDAFTRDGVEAWTVEDGGRIRHCADVSASNPNWQFQTTPDSVRDLLRRIYFLPNGTDGWAVGENGAFIFTEDGGSSWDLWSGAEVGSGTEDLWDVHFVDDGSEAEGVNDFETACT